MSKEVMEIDDQSNVGTPEAEETDSCLRLVGYGEGGEGLPYAPENWPRPGDIWGWNVQGKRTASGYQLERHLYLPASFHHLADVPPDIRENGFTSKLSVESFLHKHFPLVDAGAFFDSFSWTIPFKQAAITGRKSWPLTITENIVNNGSCSYSAPPLANSDHPADLLSNTGACKAGNTVCSSLEMSIDSPPLAAADCNICCSEPQFCRDCCCILCSKTVDPSHGSYSYIKCQSVVTACFICSHVAHLECALRAYLAGTVGGSIGLDAEYSCRRCDVKTDLVPHAVKAFQACRFIDSRDEIEKILNICICILRGSQKDNVRVLLRRIESAVRKLKLGTTLRDIWKADKDAPAVNRLDKKPSLPNFRSDKNDYNAEILKLDVEVDDVLHSLRKYQELEYEIAEEQLHAQKENLQNLYRQLQRELSALAHLQFGTARDGLWNTVTSRLAMIDWERKKLAHLKEVAVGFGKTSKKRNPSGWESRKQEKGSSSSCWKTEVVVLEQGPK